MNTIKYYYLIIPIKDVRLKEMKKNVIISDGGAATNIFNELNIPEEMQKIILKISFGGLVPPKDAFELITSEMFCFQTSIIGHILGKKNDMIMILSHNAEIYTDCSISHADEVKEFYQKIIDSGLALNYETAVKRMFNRVKEKPENKILKKEY